MTEIWQLDPERPIFRYSNVEHWFEGASLEEILEAFNNPAVTSFHQLKIMSTTDFEEDALEERIFVSPIGECFTLLFSQMQNSYDSKDEYALDLKKNPELFEWLVAPIYNENGSLTVFWNPDIWNVRWDGVEVDEFETIRLPRDTNFYEVYNYWPWFDGEPLTLVGELNIANKRAFMFSNGVAADFAWIAGNEPPSKISKGPYPDFDKYNLAEKTQIQFLEKYDFYDRKYPASYYVPREPLPKTLLTCQDPVLPPAETPFPIVHFPPLNLRIDDEVDTGDLGSTLVFWDGKDKFFLEYTQT
jgi:hypothetical protein